MFYLNVLSRFAASRGLKLKVSVEIAPEGGLAEHQVQEIMAALRALGLGDHLELSRREE